MKYQGYLQRTASFVIQSCYIENLVAVMDDKEDGLKIYQEARQFTGEAKMALAKWRSNLGAPEDKFVTNGASNTVINSDHPQHETGIEHGLLAASTDSVKQNLPTIVKMKIGAVGISQNFFYLLGLFSPFTIHTRILFQPCRKTK